MIFQSTVYPNVIPVNGILQQYLVSGGAISAGDFVQFADAVATGTKTLIGVEPALAVQLNETDVLVISARTNYVINAVVVRFSGQSVSIGGITAIASGTSSKVYEAKSAAVLSPMQVVVGLGKTVSSGVSSNMGLFAEAVLLSVSGLDITASEPATLSKITYNENGEVGDVNVIALSETSGIALYGFNNGSGVSSPCPNYATAISLMDNTLSAGTPVSLTGSSSSGYGTSAETSGVKISETTVVASASGFLASGYVLNINGTDVSIASSLQIDTSSASDPSYVVDIGTNMLLFVWRHASGTSLEIRAGYYNGGSVTLGKTTKITGQKSNAAADGALKISDGIALVCCGGKATIIEVNDDLSITAGETVTLYTPTSTYGVAHVYACRISKTAVFFYGYASCPARIEGLTIIPGTITTPASADRLTAAHYSESAGTLRVFGGSSASNGFANTETTMVQPYSNAAYGVASTGGAVGETIDVFLPKA